MIKYILGVAFRTLKDRRTWLVIAFIVWSYLVAFFNANYYTQSPVKEWQRIIVPRQSVKPIKNARVMTVQALETKKPIPVPLTEEQLVRSQKHGDILWNIYQLETQRGKTDYCRTFGTFGGFGVKNEKNEIHCYMTFKEAAERASYWFGAHYPSKTLVDALCTWNKGTKERPNGGYMNCWYYQQYMSL